MPQFEVELSDGNVVTLESDHEPSDQEVLEAVKQFDSRNTPPPPTPASFQPDQRQAQRAEIERELGYPRDLPKATGATGFREEVQERFGEYAKGLTGIVPAAMKVASVFAPSALDYITGGQGALFTPPVQLQPPEQQPLYKAGEVVSRELESIWPSPEVPDIGHGVMQGFGQMGPMLGVGAGARAAGLGMKGVLTATTGLGAIQEFDDAYTRARKRGDEPDKAFAKSLGYATVAGLIENKLGAGRLLRQMFPEAKEAVKRLTALGVSKKILGNFVAGGLEEGSQRFAQNWIVDEKPSLEGVSEEAIPGAIVEGVLGLPGAAVQPAQRNRPTERTSNAVQQKATGAVRDVQQPEVTQESPQPLPTDQGGQETPETRIIKELRLEGVTQDDAEALVSGKKTVREVVEGNFKVTPSRVVGEEQGHDEAFAEGYNQAIERLTTILSERTPLTAEQAAKNVDMTLSGVTPSQVPGQSALWDFRFKEPGNEMFFVVVPETYTLDQIQKSKAAKIEQLKQSGDWKEVTPTEKEESQEKEPVLTPSEERISTPPQTSDPFEMDDADLADILETEYGQRETGESALAAGRAGTYTFPTYDAFKTWMDARYSERDLEGMKLAFAEADTTTKVRYIKEHKAADAHKKAWIANLATGAPIPTTDPPVVRTTPRPGPTGAPIVPGPTPGAPPTPPPPSRPAPAPAPPRPPTNRRKFDIMALVQLFRQFSRFPVVNERLMRAYGRFVPGTSAVELKARLMWDTKLAERVLGHEIGHFLDLAIAQIGRGKMLAQRLRPLYDFRGRMWQAQDLKDEARRLSRAWRGPFLNGHPYRDTANELFADFMSAMFNSPEWVNQNFPTLFDAFQEVLDDKPAFKSAYREIETWLQGGTMAKEFIEQQQKSVERTLDILEKSVKGEKASLWDRIYFATVSPWRRVWQKEGKPRELGTAIADELELIKMWADKENAIAADDFLKLVNPHLQNVSNDPVRARALLTAYSQAVRTIGERRAAGKWIETHPTEARALLNRVLSLDPTLQSKWGGALSTATNDQLYDLSAAIFREIHDRGDKFVNRIAKAIDDLGLGVEGEAALMAFNVRGKLLNPGGLTVEQSQAVLDELKRQLNPTQYAALERSAEELRDIMWRTQEAMHDEGLISDKTWNELIVPNRNNYVPYAVLDYFDGSVRAGVMPQKGTARDVADVAAAVQLKVASANSWRQKQRQVQLIRDAYQRGGLPIPVGQKLKRSADIDKIRNDNRNDDISRAVLWVDGEPHLVEFPDDRGKMIEKAMDIPAFYEHIEWIAEASDLSHRVMQLYTQFSIPFLFWRNPVRGVRTGALRTGFIRTGQQLTPQQLAHNLRLARNYARAAFGGTMLPEVRDLVDRQILLPPRLSQSMVRDSATLRSLIENNTILANMVRRAHAGQPKWWKGGDLGRQAVALSEKLFTTYEAFEKIYNYNAALAKGLPIEKAGALARRAGIPKPGVGGKWSLAMEVWWPWTRVHMQGLRSTLDVLQDPELGRAFAIRFALTEAMPRVAKVLIGAGVVAGAIKWAIRDDDDKDDGVMAEFMRRVSPYKMALDDTVPLYFYDPRTGKVHYIWEYKRGKDVPKHFEAVSLRLPASEEGRLWGVLLYNIMTAGPGVKEKMGQPGKGLTEATGQWAVNYLAPGLNPIIETSDNLKDMLLLGKNPEDAYRGVPAANPMMFEAGGVDRAQAIAGYTLNQLGSAGELAGVMAANFGLLDKRALNAFSKRLPSDYSQWNEKVPFLKTAVAHDNYGQYREEKTEQLEEEKIRVRARLLMPEEVRGLYDFYYRNLNRQDKLTDLETEQFDISREFITQVWGTLTVDGEPNPDSFYGKAAHAVGKDGSAEAKKTFQRDITAAASPYISAFTHFRNMPEAKPAPGTPR